jgi:4-amino-4-deoxy-L-arabinose transferase-like glycosyltransferase
MRLDRTRVWIILLTLATIVGVFHGTHLRDPHVERGDTPAYLAAAFNLARHGTFSEALTPGEPAPAVGREPAYPALLAVLIRVDSTGLGRVSQTCIEASGPCAASFRSGQIANIVLWVLAALVLAQAVLLLPFGTPLAALIAGAYLLLNFAAAKWLQWLVSDALALFLVSLTTCLAAWAMRHRSWSAWIPVGLGLGALAMTKAVFVPFAALAVLAATFLGAVWRSRRVLLAAAAFGLGFLLVAGPWVARNTVVTGRPQLTDARSGIALNLREVLIHMSPREYAASLVFWTRGVGDALATRLFGEETVRPLRFETPGGFYDVGQNGYMPRVEAEVARGLSEPDAYSRVDREIIGSILGEPLRYLATMVPVFYRGIWIDEFIIVGLPALVWATGRAARTRNWALLALMSVGWFNLLFYPLISLNIPRYQLTALPCLALATGLAWNAFWQRCTSRANESRADCTE